MRQIRELIALFVLAISAYTDIKERNIYTMPLIVSAAGAVIMSVIMIIGAPAGEECDIFYSELAGPALVGALIIFAAALFKGHIGAGDAYLLAALGFILGIRQHLGTMIIAVFAAFIYAGVCVMIGRTQKRRFYAEIPFAPFVMIGFVFVIAGGAV